MDKEIWKDIPGYEGMYQCSDLGNVKSLNRNCIGKCNSIKTILGQILKPNINHYGYMVLYLCKNGIKKTITVHQLVAITF